MTKATISCQDCTHSLCVGRVPIFSSLGQEALDQIAALVTQRDFAKGELIVPEGRDLGGLIIINSGRVKTFRYTSDGRERILQILTDGDFVGEKNLLTRQRLTYSAEALVDTKTCFISREAFHRLMREYPDIIFDITSELCRRLERLEGMIQQLGLGEATQRVIAVLWEFAQQYGEQTDSGTLISLPLSREDLANYIGVTRETISRKLNQMQAEGILRLIGNRKVLVYDLDSLVTRQH
ncbi:MAG: Crp/Fnr family transcriptional regulator [Firmicutes bacterium]|nr:Crp/Fnr family transcriptional regulator [Bacillota bacterium]